VGVQTDASGRVQLSVGYGAGQFEDRSLNCSGDIIGIEPVPFRAGGAQLDLWPNGSTRISAFGGWSAGVMDDAWGGVQGAWEGRFVGLGFGVAHAPFHDVHTVPSTYLRLGNRDGLHFRSETFPPTTAIGITGDVFRMGVGFNRGLRAGPRWFAGATLGPYVDERGGGGIFGEVELPIQSRLDLSLGASLRDATQYFDGGGRVGLRYHFK
jgi:hypothetical protein